MIKGTEYLFTRPARWWANAPAAADDVAEMQKGFFCQNERLQICNLEKQQVVGDEAQTAHQGHRDGAAQRWPRPCDRLYSEKTGKTYDATVVLEDDGQYANFKLEFDQQKGGKR